MQPLDLAIAVIDAQNEITEIDARALKLAGIVAKMQLTIRAAEKELADLTAPTVEDRLMAAAVIASAQVVLQDAVQTMQSAQRDAEELRAEIKPFMEILQGSAENA